jgi:YidC/Oxa1 family membrane protein insertase
MDRRIIWAIIAMMLIAILPSLFLKRPPRVSPAPAGQAPVGPEAPGPEATQVPRIGAPPGVAVEDSLQDLAAEADTVVVRSPLYQYAISTMGGRFAGITLPTYRSMAPADRDAPVQLLHPESDLLGLRVLVGRDTLHLDRWVLTPSASALSVADPTALTLTATRGGVTARLRYEFVPDNYLIRAEGEITGLGPNGGVLMVGLGPGIRNTEADSIDNQRQLAVVTMANGAEATNFHKLDAGQTTALDGPFQWVAVKSKYFVTALFTLDSLHPRITGVAATPPPNAGNNPTRADIDASLSLGADGRFAYQLYAGPMEHDRLRAIGHDFDDVNPYGWPGFRTIIRPVAVAARWLLVWMHDNLNLAYGLVLVCFGIMIRIILWPLNQKAMRSSMEMQAIQPQLKEIQDRYKNEPQKLQQEMFKLYKEHGVNPFGGCWPLLIPMPVLFALFFVLGNTIELRGESFLWLPDLSRADPLFIVPVLMGLSMFVLSKVGSRGLPPSPQTKIMLYVMPVMMTVLFVSFPSGLNLYYAVQNTASIPQQWLLSKERMRRNPPAPPKPEPRGKAKSRK